MSSAASFKDLSFGNARAGRACSRILELCDDQLGARDYSTVIRHARERETESALVAAGAIAAFASARVSKSRASSIAEQPPKRAPQLADGVTLVPATVRQDDALGRPCDHRLDRASQFGV